MKLPGRHGRCIPKARQGKARQVRSPAIGRYAQFFGLSKMIIAPSSTLAWIVHIASFLPQPLRLLIYHFFTNIMLPHAIYSMFPRCAHKHKRNKTSNSFAAIPVCVTPYAQFLNIVYSEVVQPSFIDASMSISTPSAPTDSPSRAPAPYPRESSGSSWQAALLCFHLIPLNPTSGTG